jgi:hypothetical protein
MASSFRIFDSSSENTVFSGLASQATSFERRLAREADTPCGRLGVRQWHNADIGWCCDDGFFFAKLAGHSPLQQEPGKMRMTKICLALKFFIALAGRRSTIMYAPRDLHSPLARNTT